MMVLQAPLASSATSTTTTSLPSTSRTSSNAATTSTSRVTVPLPKLKIKSSNSTTSSSPTIAAPIREAEEIAARIHLDATISTLERLFSSSGGTFPPSPSDPPSSPRRRPPVRVAYQGVRGSYCQEAAARAFASSALSPSGTGLDSAFTALHVGAADRAVVPVENSHDGSIPRNLDLLLRHAATVEIVGEIVLPVNHCLLCLPGAAAASKIRRVVSHPQAISHCRRSLDLLNLDAVDEVDNAAEFASYVAENRIADTAVIGSAIAAREFGLEILHHNFQDKPGSFNRFLQLGLKSAAPTSSTVGTNKTTVAFSLNNGPSDLFQAMWAFESRGVKVSRVDHRPNRNNPLRAGYFNYVYIMDLEASTTTKSDAALRTGINRLRQFTGFLQVLGSYATN